jgi:hypothetical protein
MDFLNLYAIIRSKPVGEAVFDTRDLPVNKISTIPLLTRLCMSAMAMIGL